MEKMVFGAAATQRPVPRSMLRGFAGRCPHCGEGKLFRVFLKVADRCEACGEDYHHHRADDLPAYLVILIVGHVAVAGFMGLERLVDLSIWTHLAILVPVTVLSSVVFLQPVKGAVVGLQWALRMHGFSGEEDDVPEEWIGEREADRR